MFKISNIKEFLAMAKKFVRKFNSKNPVPVSYVKSFDSFEDGYKEVLPKCR